MIKPVKEEFPYNDFPIKIVHKDGKDLKETKTCYFQCEEHAKKYLDRAKFKKKDYTMTIRGEENEEQK